MTSSKYTHSQINPYIMKLGWQGTRNNIEAYLVDILALQRYVNFSYKNGYIVEDDAMADINKLNAPGSVY